MNRRWMIGIAVGLLLGAAAAAQVFPIRWDDEAEAAPLDSAGILVAQAILLTPVTTAPFACDASTEGTLIFVGDTNQDTKDHRHCFCGNGTWKQLGFGECGFQTP